MEEEQNGSPIEFRHDSMLRIAQPHEDPQISPLKKPKTDNTVSARGKSNLCKERFGFSVLQSGTQSGIDFAVLCITESIILSGCGWLSVLHQGVRIFGHTVGENDKAIFVLSAPFAPLLLKLTPCQSSGEEKKCMEGAKTERKQGPAAIIHNQIKRSLGSDFEVADSTAAIVLISSCPRDEQLWKAADGSSESDDLAFSLSETLQRLSLPNFDSFVPIVPSLQISRSTEHSAPFEEWESWDSFLHEIDVFLAERPWSELRVLVSGSGGSGKSTFVRCLSNHLATVCGGLLLIDTDVGQPELNLPGLVAAHHVSELHIGSAIAHIRGVPVAARLLGETTPRDDPDLYEACITAVSDNGLAHATRNGLPVVINTDGWVSGAGSDFLTSVVRRTRPTHTVSMFAGKGQANGPRPSFRTNTSELRTFYMQRPQNESRPVYTRSVARELQIAAYFCKELCLGRVRAVAMDGMPVVLRGEEVASVDRALLLMNASIVAIGTSTGTSKLHMGESNVVGYGLVRGVSLENKMAYISTPVPLGVLKQSVVLIICEHIHVPNAVMLSTSCGSHEGTSSPFTLKDHVDGSHHMHSRSSLQRRTTNVAEG